MRTLLILFLMVGVASAECITQDGKKYCNISFDYQFNMSKCLEKKSHEECMEQAIKEAQEKSEKLGIPLQVVFW